jgi:hypothetical protein
MPKKHDHVHRSADIAQCAVGHDHDEPDGRDGPHRHEELRDQELAHAHPLVADQDEEVGQRDDDRRRHHGPEQERAKDLLENGDHGTECKLFHL